MESSGGSKTPSAGSDGVRNRRIQRRMQPLRDCTNTVTSSAMSAPPKLGAPPKFNPSTETTGIGSIGAFVRTIDATDPEEVKRAIDAEKRRIKGKAIEVSSCSYSPVNWPMHHSREDINGETDVNLSKSCPLPAAKRKESHTSVSLRKPRALEDCLKQQKSYCTDVVLSKSCPLPAAKRKKSHTSVSLRNPHTLEDCIQLPKSYSRDVGLSKSCPLPARKRKKSHTSVSVEEPHALEDYIKQQKSYFAEVDAFELLEEEVEPSDQSD